MLINVNQYTTVRDITEIIHDTVRQQPTDQESPSQNTVYCLFTVSTDSGEQNLPVSRLYKFPIASQILLTIF